MRNAVCSGECVTVYEREGGSAFVGASLCPCALQRAFRHPLFAPCATGVAVPVPCQGMGTPEICTNTLPT